MKTALAVLAAATLLSAQKSPVKPADFGKCETQAFGTRRVW